jgi:hypothetical protein
MAVIGRPFKYIVAIFAPIAAKRPASDPLAHKWAGSPWR